MLCNWRQVSASDDTVDKGHNLVIMCTTSVGILQIMIETGGAHAIGSRITESSAWRAARRSRINTVQSPCPQKGLLAVPGAVFSYIVGGLSASLFCLSCTSLLAFSIIGPPSL